MEDKGRMTTKQNDFTPWTHS